jgi:hypothetical protein
LLDPQTNVDELTEWEQRLRAAVEQTLRKRAPRATERREFKARRDAGLVQRYAEKSARIRRQEDTVPDLPECCASVEEPPCQQHAQAARVSGRQGPRNRSARPSAVIGDSGQTKTAAPPHIREEQ